MTPVPVLTCLGHAARPAVGIVTESSSREMESVLNTTCTSPDYVSDPANAQLASEILWGSDMKDTRLAVIIIAIVLAITGFISTITLLMKHNYKVNTRFRNDSGNQPETAAFLTWQS